MKCKLLVLITCSPMMFLLTIFELNALAASVETVGELKTSGGIRFNDDSLQTSACSGCANGILSISLGGTGGDTASEARTNLAVPGLQTPNTFTADQNCQGDISVSRNINIPDSTATTGIIYSGANTLLHTVGHSNIFVGENAGNLSLTSAEFNTGIGFRALNALTSGNSNTSLGANALFNNTSGQANTAIGSHSLLYTSTGDYNTANGYYSLGLNTTASKNTSIGADSLASQSFSNTNTTWDSHNTAVGYNALHSNQPTATSNGVYNSATGSGALKSNTIGHRNTAVGGNSLLYNTTASKNTALGVDALRDQSFSNGSTVWDSHNTAVGFEALISNQPTTTSNGAYNTATGSLSLRSNTTGYYNTAIGSESLRENTTGHRNTAIGREALHDNTGSYNTSIGYRSLDKTTAGEQNIALGAVAGSTNVSGDNNTYIGAFADATGSNFSNSTAIGYMATVNASNKVVIGNSAVSSIGGYANWSNYSDRRVKSDIREIVHGLDLIMKLKPVQFRMNNGNGNTDFGFIAQDIEEILGTGYNVLDIGGGEERMLSLRYSEFIAPMVKAIQEQDKVIEAQKERIEILEERLARLEALLINR